MHPERRSVPWCDFHLCDLKTNQVQSNDRHGVPRWTEVDFKSQPDLRVVGVCFENISVGNMQLLQNHTHLQVQYIQVGWGCLAIFTKSGSTQPRLSHWYLPWYFQTCWLCCGASKISNTQKSRETRGKDWSDQNNAICQGNDMEGIIITMFMRKRYAVCVCKLLVLRL